MLKRCLVIIFLTVTIGKYGYLNAEIHYKHIPITIDITLPSDKKLNENAKSKWSIVWDNKNVPTDTGVITKLKTEIEVAANDYKDSELELGIRLFYCGTGHDSPCSIKDLKNLHKIEKNLDGSYRPIVSSFTILK